MWKENDEKERGECKLVQRQGNLRRVPREREGGGEEEEEEGGMEKKLLPCVRLHMWCYCLEDYMEGLFFFKWTNVLNFFF